MGQRVNNIDHSPVDLDALSTILRLSVYTCTGAKEELATGRLCRTGGFVCKSDKLFRDLFLFRTILCLGAPKKASCSWIGRDENAAKISEYCLRLGLSSKIHPCQPALIPCTPPLYLVENIRPHEIWPETTVPVRLNISGYPTWVVSVSVFSRFMWLRLFCFQLPVRVWPFYQPV